MKLIGCLLLVFVEGSMYGVMIVVGGKSVGRVS
jgi:hypothetical protein